MKMKIREIVDDKRILIWGYGREGKATKEFLESHCTCKKIDVFEGKQNDIDEDSYDLIIKSPGIKPEWTNEKYTGQTELFLQEFSDRTIGITGTKGKSTTSTLLFHVLDKCTDKKAFLVGNIGKPCLDIYDEIDENSVIVFEMSCHQLASVKTSPHIAIFLNLFEDHLDYYGSIEKYFDAKKNIAKYQNKDDFLIVGEDVPDIETSAKRIVVPYVPEERFEITLKGEHNQFDANVVYTACVNLLGCESYAVKEAMKTFKGLSHRMEFVANINGVDYYNDSISTIPQASIQALGSIENAKTILIGGLDRNINYKPLIDFIKNHNQFFYILSYESGKRIYNEVSGLDCCFYRENLEESVSLAKEITPEGFACILSPAAASYGYFKDFEERGNAFKEFVLSTKD